MNEAMVLCLLCIAQYGLLIDDSEAHRATTTGHRHFPCVACSFGLCLNRRRLPAVPATKASTKGLIRVDARKVMCGIRIYVCGTIYLLFQQNGHLSDGKLRLKYDN